MNVHDTMPLHLAPRDRDILRQLGARKAEIALHPVNEERRRAWLALDCGEGDRVMVLAEHGGIRDARRPFSGDRLECVDGWARSVEAGLRADIWLFEQLQDDHVAEPWLNAGWQVSCSDYGVQAVVHQGGDATHMGSRRWDPPIRDLDRDFDKLRPRTFAVDRDATLTAMERLENVLGDILQVRLRGSHYWTMGLTWRAIELIGLDHLMLTMYDQPQGLHRLMAFLRDDHQAFSDWLETEGLYTLNNENDYIGSGSMGYTADLPRGGRPADAPVAAPVDTSADTPVPVTAADLWVLLESQETVGVGPEFFEEFIFPYQSSLAARFGKTYYGCCEPVDNRWHVIERIPNLARVSVSPWADQEAMAAALGRDYVFSRKPNPTLISTGVFDERAIRADIRRTLEIARGCRLEIIMKDVHTLNEEPERLARWVRIAREEIDKAG